MSKLFPYIAAFFFAVFVIGVFAAMMFYSWQGLSNIFPGDLLGQGFGMLLFDIAALIWFGAMAYRSFSISQYVVSFVGFLVALLGSLGLIGIEVGLSSGMLQVAMMQKPLTYIFIGVLVGHVVLIYAHHATAPQMAADISLGIEKAKITDKAQAAVEEQIDKQIDQLAAPIAQKLMLGVLQDLKISAHFKDTLDLKALPVDEENAKQGEQVQTGFLSWLPPFLVNGVRKWNTNAASVPDYLSQVTPKPSPAAQSAGSDEAADLSEKQK